VPRREAEPSIRASTPLQPPGKRKPAGCTSCHDTHSRALPPSAGAVNNLCEKCHAGAMQQVEQGVHKNVQSAIAGKMSCVSCHDRHATHKPLRDDQTLEAANLPPDYGEKFKGSVHEQMFAKAR